MTTITLITFLCLCCIVLAVKEQKKSKEAYLRYKIYLEEYRKMFGTHQAMKQSYSEWTDHLFLFFIYVLSSIVLAGVIYHLIKTGLWQAL